MNKVDELIYDNYIKNGAFHFVPYKTIKNENGTYRKITLETDYFAGQTTICFEFVNLGGWGVSATYFYKGEYRGAILGRKALNTQNKILKALENMDKEVLNNEKEN